MTHTTQKPSAILRLAKARIDTPEKWGQGVQRQRHCAMDALEDAAWSRNQPKREVCRLFCLAIDTNRVGEFNDTHTHAEVMDAFDRAIALAEAEEARQ